MPILFAAVVVAALWPLKRWLDRWLPSWLSYAIAILTLVVVLTGFAIAVALSVVQVISVIGNQWSRFLTKYNAVGGWLAQWGDAITPELHTALDQAARGAA